MQSNEEQKDQSNQGNEQMREDVVSMGGIFLIFYNFYKRESMRRILRLRRQ